MNNFLAAAKATTKPPMPHQQAAWSYAWEMLSDEEQVTFLDKFRADPPAKAITDPDYADKLIKHGVPAKATSVLLAVPYEYQNDNKSGTGYRECFSSSCAMLAKFWGKVRSDDEYNAIRSKFGDTTDSQSQLAALRSLKLQARFVTNAAPGLIELELRSGHPVAVGWLHQGPYNAPSGGGHWSVVVGFDPGYWILNDPNGEADLINGGYVNHTKGAGVKYSKERFNRRWCEIDGASTGWCLLVKP